MKKDIPITIVNCKEDGINFLTKRSHFFHYTTISSYELIKKELFFKLSNPTNGCNDLDEEKRNIYMFCFCQSSTERVPFWVNYATTDNGLAIRLT